MIETEIEGVALQIETDPEVFSPSHIDRGTLAMLSEIRFASGEQVLDLGCGCGIVGIYCAKKIGGENVSMCDISERAVSLSAKNALRNNVNIKSISVSDGLKSVGGSFTLILSNPPYHTDFAVAKAFIEDGFRRLAVGGRMMMVTKRLDWYKNKLTSVFGGVKIFEHDDYFVFLAEKRAARTCKKEKPAPALSKKLARKKKNAADKRPPLKEIR